MDKSHSKNDAVAPAEKDGDILTGFVSKERLAEEFGVSPRTIERWIRLRFLPPPVRLGRTTLYHVETVRMHLLDARLHAGGRR